MPHPTSGVDHVFILVRDLNVSLKQFKALGFTVSPRGFHGEAMGTANHTIMFPRDYFELLGIVAPTDLNAPRRNRLAQDGEGLHAIACRIEDAAKAQTQLAELGIATHGLNDFARPVMLPDGGTGEAAFTTLQFDPEEVPLGSMFMCQHKTPELVWLPELMDHANGAIGLAGIVGLSDKPQQAAEGFARLFAGGTVTSIEGDAIVSTGAASAPLSFLGPAAMAASFPEFDLGLLPAKAFAALRFQVNDLEKTRAALRDNSVPFAETQMGVAVAPDRASGTIVEFTENA